MSTYLLRVPKITFILAAPRRLYDELLKINGSDAKPWVETRIKQLEDYWHLERYQMGAQVMLQAANEFELTGNFDALKVLADAVSSTHIVYKEIMYFYFPMAWDSHRTVGAPWAAKQ